MMTQIMRFSLKAALLVCLLPACSTTDANSPGDNLADYDLETPVSATEAVSDQQPEKAVLVQEAESVMKTADEDVVDYAIADYKSFDPSGIIVHFEFDDARLSDSTIAALDKIVAGMKKDPLARVSVRGHADKQGAEKYNKGLSGKRAKAIEDYLTKHGIERDRLNPISMGESDPVEEGNSIAVFKKNRRGDFNINYGPSAFGKAP